MKFALFLLSLVYLESSSLILDCLFDQELLFDDLKVSYTCNVEHLQTNETKRNVSEINGRHQWSKTHEDVTQLYIQNQNMEYFPIGFTTFFENIVAVHAGMNKLKYLEKYDLKGFKKMRYLYLYSNLLETLQSDVFEYSSVLEYVSFYNNRLMHIGAKILLPLKRLKSAYFNKNICIDKMATSEQVMSELRLEIAEKCSDITDEDLMDTLKFNQMKIINLEEKVDQISEQLANVMEALKGIRSDNNTV